MKTTLQEDIFTIKSKHPVVIINHPETDGIAQTIPEA